MDLRGGRQICADLLWTMQIGEGILAKEATSFRLFFAGMRTDTDEFFFYENRIIVFTMTPRTVFFMGECAFFGVFNTSSYISNY